MSIIHIHIPKSAGTSINAQLSSMFPSYHNYGRVHKISTTEKKKIKKSTCIFGHISIRELENLKFPLDTAFTVLRDPITRCLSWYRMIVGEKNVSPFTFFKTEGANLVSKNEFLRNCKNRMTFQLGDFADIKRRTLSGEEALEKAQGILKKLKTVVFYEDLCKTSNIEILNIKSLKKLKKGGDRGRLPPKKVSDLIRSLNEYDIRLYELAKKMKTSGDIIA